MRPGVTGRRSFVTGETLDFFSVAQRHLTAHLCVVGPVCRTVEVESGTRLRINRADNSEGVVVRYSYLKLVTFVMSRPKR